MTVMDRDLFAALRTVELPTLGHFLEDGFCDQRVASVNQVTQMVGIARTLDLQEPDALAVNRAVLALTPGDVLVIRVEGRQHAPVGAVTAAAAFARGAAGIVVDGPVTDIVALREWAPRLPIFATGLTARTTKRLGTLDDRVRDAVIDVGGVQVHPGDWVLGDPHGILVLPPDGPGRDVLHQALASDAAEPALRARIAAAEPLESLLLTDLPPITP